MFDAFGYGVVAQLTRTTIHVALTMLVDGNTGLAERLVQYRRFLLHGLVEFAVAVARPASILLHLALRVILKRLPTPGGREALHFILKGPVLQLRYRQLVEHCIQLVRNEQTLSAQLSCVTHATRAQACVVLAALRQLSSV